MERKKVIIKIKGERKMKVKDLVSVIDFSKNKWLNVGYFDEQNTFINIMEYCDCAIYIYFEDVKTKEEIIMNSIIDKKTPKIGAYLGLMSLLSR